MRPWRLRSGVSSPQEDWRFIRIFVRKEIHMKSTSRVNGYTSRVLRVDLNHEKITEEYLDEHTLKTYIGGVGLGAKYLYEEVPPGTAWDDPENRLIFATGPLNGTHIAGAGTFCIVTKGPLTNGAASSQANGYFGSYLKLSGVDAVILQGKAKRWLYLYIHDGTAELRDAQPIMGKDTWETGELVGRELNKAEDQLSVFSIGPAGENLVKFSAVIGDMGHVAGHNGIGAVMGSKKLKAIAAAKGTQEITPLNETGFEAARKAMLDEFMGSPIQKFGTTVLFVPGNQGGTLPVKNLTTNIYPEFNNFAVDNVYSRLETIKKHPCWDCLAHHCNIMKVKEGPYAGYIGEEPEYEGWAGFAPMVGAGDVEGAFVLSNLCDRLGLELNEASWLMAFAIECYEKGIITDRETGGLKLNWGNVEAIMVMLKKIAYREGFGAVLAEGTMRTAQKLGPEAEKIGVYQKKGHSPRGHDHRARWVEMLDVATSNTGTLETGGVRVEDAFSWEKISTEVAKKKGIRTFIDALSVCMICTNTMGTVHFEPLVDAMNAVTGWNFTPEEARTAGLRIVNLMRAFNIRHGVTPDVEYPSTRYSSVPVDGPSKGQNVALHWDDMLENYYNIMGWDRDSGKPLPETLEKLGLKHIIPDLW
jgi:aldehyde:ferredoxin oxidoreductase